MTSENSHPDLPSPNISSAPNGEPSESSEETSPERKIVILVPDGESSESSEASSPAVDILVLTPEGMPSEILEELSEVDVLIACADELKPQWQQEFLALPTDERLMLVASLSAQWFRFVLMHYMRAYAERAMSSIGTYTDRSVGKEEVQRIAGHLLDASASSQAWADAHGLPSLEEAQKRIHLVTLQLEAIEALDLDLPQARIQRAFALSKDAMALLLCVAIPATSESLTRLMTVAWADFGTRLPTISFLTALLARNEAHHNALLKELSSDGTLMRMRLLVAERHPLYGPRTPLLYTLLNIDQRVVDAIFGWQNQAQLPLGMTLHTEALRKQQLILEGDAWEALEHILAERRRHVILIGAKHSGRRTMLASLAIHTFKKRLLEVDLIRMLQNSDTFLDSFSEVLRESLLLDAILLLRFDDLQDNPLLTARLEEFASSLHRTVSHYSGNLVCLATKALPGIETAMGHPIALTLPLPSLDLSAQGWKRALTGRVRDDELEKMVQKFAINYQLPMGDIFMAIEQAVIRGQVSSQDDDDCLQSHHILEEIRKRFKHNLGELAEIGVSSTPLSGVILPCDAREKVEEILQYARNLPTVLDTWGFRQRSPYGNALSILLFGPPGTGKTFLANGLSNELGKVLYRVDLSRIVDKYIGETEKNLAKIFDEAGKAQAIILFDEADSLFSKRTEVKSSNDRYANLEVNFLLQKLESYNGITILTTNQSTSIDDAFRRRIRYIIEFPMPDAAARTELWKRLVPPHAPIEKDICWSYLGRTFEMSGGHIRNACLKASIQAAANNIEISSDLLTKAAVDEARTLGKLIRIDPYDE